MAGAWLPDTGRDGGADPARPAADAMTADGRLSVRPVAATGVAARTGLLRLAGPDGGPPALAFVPEPADGGPYRLVVSLHGAGGSARQGLALLQPVAEEHRLLLVAPQSGGATWDFLHGGLGPDVRGLDRVLAEVLDGCPVDRMAIGGFSDGASYALTLGLANGDLFDAVVAFSPGFAAPPVTYGKPRIFVSHGTADRVLPVDRCSRRLVPRLRTAGHDVTYDEFAGGHEIPDATMRRAARWLTGGV